MGTLRFWSWLVAAQIVVLIALALAGPVTASTPALRYTGFACLFGLFACVPPIVLKSFVAAQVKIGNGALPMVRAVDRHQTGITIGVWAMTVVALVLALPRIRADIAADAAQNAPVETGLPTQHAPAASGANSASPAAAGVRTLAGSTDSIVATAPDTPASPPTVTAPQPPLITPATGSPARTAVLDALRQRLRMTGRFKVDHIRVTGAWAFVRATEVVELDKGELQETDLTVSALLRQSPNAANGGWAIVELWTLPDEQTHPFADFARSLRERVKRERLPAGLLPDDLGP